ncbi:hypothetical protein K8I61_17055 [bacterium]|nr:hypothetical protein [bacterium]
MLSGLVLPGAGQIYLGHRARGAIIAALTLAFVGFFVVQLARGFGAYFELLTALADPGADPASVQSAAGKRMLTGVVFGGVPATALWVYASIDAWRLGKGAGRRA